jgi:hypothetical protein
MKRGLTDEERFLQHVHPEPNSGCWLWTGGLKCRGYGGFRLRKDRYTFSHRISYELFVGEIPKGLHVCHKCDNPFCVNPEHLFVGTSKQNMEDRDSKGRFHVLKGEKVGASILTNDQALKIFQSKSPQDILAKTFGVSVSTIRAIKSKRLWRHVTCEQ